MIGSDSKISDETVEIGTSVAFRHRDTDNAGVVSPQPEVAGMIFADDVDAFHGVPQAVASLVA